MTSNHFVSWLHIGDLHASQEDNWQSVDLLSCIVEEINHRTLPHAIDFVFLPGDNANHGEPEQYRRIAQALSPLTLPWHAIAGDHDFEPGSLDNFRAALAHSPLPRAVHVNGRRALFLDIVSAGSGGPDFRLGAQQTAWLQHELEQAQSRSEPGALIFMHAFPEDLKEGGQELGRMFADAKVALVDTGHTHYNELLNDGAVIYAATRSTGQIEEGEAGFTIAAVDGDVASWRFKPLASAWPFVLITSPADERMAVRSTLASSLYAHASSNSKTSDSWMEVRALVMGTDVESVELTLDDCEAVRMQPVRERASLWSARIERPSSGTHRISVRARASEAPTIPDAMGTAPCEDGHDEIHFTLGAKPRALDTFGEHRHTVGAWPDRGVLGTRLGPNANGKHW